MCSPDATMMYMQDMLFHMNRIEGIKESLLAGQFPVRIQGYQMDGYGYAAGVFYPGLFLYFPAVLRLLGIPVGLSYNLFILFIQVLTAGFAYYAFTLFFRSHKMGAVAASLYVLCGYRLYNIFIRGDVGEAAAMAFLPLALFSVYDVLYRNSSRWWLVILSYTGLLETHLLTSMVCIIYAFVLLGIRAIQRREIFWKKIFSVLGITFLLNAWFLIPFLDFYFHVAVNIQASLTSIQEKGHSLLEVVWLLAVWHTGLIFGMALCGYYQRKHELTVPLRKWWAAAFLLVWMVTYWFPWDLFSRIPFLSTVIQTLQYPWRMYEYAAIVFTCLAAWGLFTWAERKNWKECSAVVCLYAAVFFAIQIYTTGFWISTKEYNEPLPSDYIALGFAYDYLPRGVDDRMAKQMSGKLDTTADIQDIRKIGTTMDFSYASDADAEATAALTCYPGYQAVDEQGNPLTLGEDEWHRLTVQLPAGSHWVHISYEEKPGYLAADGISVLTLFGLAGYIYRRRKAIQEDWRNIDRVS